jgi:hypothetical protein
MNLILSGFLALNVCLAAPTAAPPNVSELVTELVQEQGKTPAEAAQQVATNHPEYASQIVSQATSLFPESAVAIVNAVWSVEAVADYFELIDLEEAAVDALPADMRQAALDQFGATGGGDDDMGTGGTGGGDLDDERNEIEDDIINDEKPGQSSPS